MASKRVADVSGDYEGSLQASDTDVRRIKREATQLQVGKLERDVDALLRAKGLRLDTPVGSRSTKPRRLSR